MTKKVILVYVTLMVVIGLITFFASRRYGSDVERELSDDRIFATRYAVQIEPDDEEDDEVEDEEGDVYYQSRRNENFFFESKIEWPKVNLYKADHAVYRMNNSENSRIRSEGKGYFLGKPDNIFADMLDPAVMGMSEIAQSIEKSHVVESGNSVFYDMNYWMRENHSDKDTFDFAVSVSVSYEQDHRGGIKRIVYKSKRMPGGSLPMFLMHEMISVEALNDNWFSISYQSEYDAFNIEKKDVRNHFRQLFERWDTNESPDTEE